MKTMRLLAILWLFLAGPAYGIDHNSIKELYLYPSFQYFNWKEFDAGRRLVKETGPLFGAGGVITLEGPKLDDGSSLTLKVKAELFGSVVDYDGHAQNVLTGQQIPSSTDVTYFGTKGELDVGGCRFF